jgi:hypothetical protein
MRLEATPSAPFQAAAAVSDPGSAIRSLMNAEVSKYAISGAEP